MIIIIVSVLWGGYQKKGGWKSVSKTVLVFQFSPVKDIFGSNSIYDDDDDEGSGDGEEYTYPDDDEEGSAESDLENENDMKVSFISENNLDHRVNRAQACGVTLAETRYNVVFVITGGVDDQGRVLDNVHKTEITVKQGSHFNIGPLRENLPDMKISRKQHGCYKV